MKGETKRFVSAFKNVRRGDKMSMDRHHMYIRAAQGGTRCPCCNTLIKVRRRPLYFGMVAFLIGLVNLYEKEKRGYFPYEVIDSISFSIKREDEGKLEHWGLVTREKVIDRKTNGHTFLFRPTQKGVDFVDGKIRVPSAS